MSLVGDRSEVHALFTLDDTVRARIRMAPALLQVFPNLANVRQTNNARNLTEIEGRNLR